MKDTAPRYEASRSSLPRRYTAPWRAWRRWRRNPLLPLLCPVKPVPYEQVRRYLPPELAEQAWGPSGRRLVRFHRLMVASAVLPSFTYPVSDAAQELERLAGWLPIALGRRVRQFGLSADLVVTANGYLLELWPDMEREWWRWRAPLPYGRRNLVLLVEGDHRYQPLTDAQVRAIGRVYGYLQFCVNRALRSLLGDVGFARMPPSASRRRRERPFGTLKDRLEDIWIAAYAVYRELGALQPPWGWSRVRGVTQPPNTLEVEIQEE